MPVTPYSVVLAYFQRYPMNVVRSYLAIIDVDGRGSLNYHSDSDSDSNFRCWPRFIWASQAGNHSPKSSRLSLVYVLSPRDAIPFVGSLPKTWHACPPTRKLWTTHWLIFERQWCWVHFKTPQGCTLYHGRKLVVSKSRMTRATESP